MGRKICDRTKDLSEQLKTDHLSNEMKVHLEGCRVCSDEYLTISWMKNYSNTETSIPDPGIPSFDTLWIESFNSKRIESDLIEKAMFPMKIAGLFSKAVIILSAIFFVLFNNAVFSGVGEQLDNINRLGSSFINPFIKLFNSSVYVSIPLTIIFASILLYLLFSIINSLNKRSLGNA